MKTYGWAVLAVCGVAMGTAWLAAEEGMFPISAIDRIGLAEKGLEMDPADLFRADETCLVDGICRVNGCTGSFVSGDGLIITNHHCAYRAIQSASTPTRDLLRDGFVAADRESEIPAPGYEVRITEDFRDVSSEVLAGVTSDMSFAERSRAIEKRRKEIEQEAERERPGVRAEVAEMFAGRTYVLFLYTFIRDVRLVFAPPASVGNFGGDVDNWEWPRHTGDFSFLRAYVAPDGSTATWAEENVPYRPKRVISVAPEGVSEDDFVFLLGYPGRTARHRTAAFLRYEEQVRLPWVVDQYGWRIATMEEASRESREVALKLTSTIKSLANVEKRSRGQLQGLRRADIVAARAAEETSLQTFIDADPERRSRYGNVLSEIAEVYREMEEAADYELNFDGLQSSSRLFGTALALWDAAVERQKEDLEREAEFMDRNFDRTRDRMLLQLRDLHAPTDAQITREMLIRLSRADASRQWDGWGEVLASPESIDLAVANWYENTELDDLEFVAAALQQTPEELAAQPDPFLQLARQLYPEFLRLRELGKQREGQLGKLYAALIDVKQEYLQTRFVPDANGTLRLTFGRVRGYSPEDAVFMSPLTTLQGVIDKTTGEPPFETPERIIELRQEGRLGPFANADLQDVPVNMLYDTDTTGGNSGSPVINARGELVGVNFDRAFGATINDFAWDASYSRSIGVDIRYVLWITGVVFEADHLLAEMGVSLKPAESR